MIRLLFLILGAFLTAQAKVLVYPFDIPAFPENVNEGILDKNNGRIINGNAAEHGDIPHQLSLRMVTTTGGVGACGASLIHSQWGLSAAHCTLGRTFVIVRLGVIDVTTPTMVIETTVWYDHPDYNPSNLNHDISLIDLRREVPLGEHIQPIRLQGSHQTGVTFENQVAKASGFGRTADDGAGSETLNHVDLLVISNTACAAVYTANVIIESTICAVGIETASQSTCSGDSGGPLTVVDDDGQRTLVGVVSFVSSRGCSSGNPSGYVRPGFYHDWIQSTTGVNLDYVLL